jgi:hypothetical protein
MRTDRSGACVHRIRLGRGHSQTEGAESGSPRVPADITLVILCVSPLFTCCSMGDHLVEAMGR